MTRIGIIDSGISMDEAGNLNHPDLMDQTRFMTSWNYLTNTTNVRDDYYHGTAVSSIIAATAGNNGPNGEENWGMVGMNVASSYAVVKTQNNEGKGTVQAICDGILFLSFCKQCGIINMSLGDANYDATYEWTLFILNLLGKHPLLVASVGNETFPGNWVAYPAKFAFYGRVNGHQRGYSNVISVGASESNCQRADYSCFELPKNYVGVLAPSGGHNDNGEILDPIWPAKPPYLQRWGQYGDYFVAFNGTSGAAPHVAGLASLIITADMAANNGVRTLSTWALRRIIEKTACRAYTDGAGGHYFPFSSTRGYGIINVPRAVQNRDYNYWQFQKYTWYLVSANVDPVDTDIRTIMEDLTLDHHTLGDPFWERLDTMATYRAQYKDTLRYDPREAVNTIVDWDPSLAYKLRLRDTTFAYTDSLLVVGKRKATDTPIQLYDDAQSAGWNWVAYYPTYIAAAHNALTSIATSGDPNSDLYLAKGPDGNFYFVGAGYDMLTMRPGEGYQMQLHRDHNVQLVYPVNDPDQAPRKHDESSQPNDDRTEHFVYRARTGDFLPVLITGVELDNRNPEESDELGIFVGDTFCVGASYWQQRQMGIAAWMDDPSTEETDGFQDWRSLTFRYYDKSADKEFGQIDIRTDADMGENASVLLTNLYFNTPQPHHQQAPVEFKINSIFPNPTNSAITLELSIPEAGQYTLSLYDADGRSITDLVIGNFREGTYAYNLNASALASGAYIVVVQGQNERAIGCFSVTR